jgi:hypothetical protein
VLFPCIFFKTKKCVSLMSLPPNMFARRFVVVVVVVVVGYQGPEPRLRLHCSDYAYYTPCFLEVPTVAARCLHVLRDAREPSNEG